MAPSRIRLIPPSPAPPWKANILGDLMVGLTTLDAAARPIPGIADHWETSRDGLTWTFHLRPARWSDGSKVTAQDFLSAWRRLLEPKTAARDAQNLWIIRNAQAITAGRLPSTALGVTAPDPATRDHHPGASRALSAGTAHPAQRPALAAGRAQDRAAPQRLCLRRPLSARKLGAQRPCHTGQKSRLL